MDEYLNLIHLSYSTDPELQENVPMYLECIHTDPNALIYCTDILLNSEFQDLSISLLVIPIIRNIFTLNKYLLTIPRDLFPELMERFHHLIGINNTHEKVFIRAFLTLSQNSGIENFKPYLDEAIKYMNDTNSVTKGITYYIEIIKKWGISNCPEIIIYFNDFFSSFYRLDHLVDESFYEIYKIILKCTPTMLLHKYSYHIYPNSIQMIIINDLIKHAVEAIKLLYNPTFFQLATLGAKVLNYIMSTLKSHCNNIDKSEYITKQFEFYKANAPIYALNCIKLLDCMIPLNENNTVLQGYLLSIVFRSFYELDIDESIYSSLYNISLYHLQLVDDNYEELLSNCRNFYFITDVDDDPFPMHFRQLSYRILQDLFKTNYDLFIQILVTQTFSEAIFHVVELAIKEIKENGIEELSDILYEYALKSADFNFDNKITIISRDMMLSLISSKLSLETKNQVFERTIELMKLPEDPNDIPEASLWISYGCIIIYNFITNEIELPIDLIDLLFNNYNFSYNSVGIDAVSLLLKKKEYQRIDYIENYLSNLFTIMTEILFDDSNSGWLSSFSEELFESCVNSYIDIIQNVDDPPLFIDNVLKLIDDCGDRQIDLIIEISKMINSILNLAPPEYGILIEKVFKMTQESRFKSYRIELFLSIFDSILLCPDLFSQTGYVFNFLLVFGQKPNQSKIKIFLIQSYKARLIQVNLLDTQNIENEIQNLYSYIDTNNDIIIQESGYELLASLCLAQIPIELDETIVALWCDFINNGGACCEYYKYLFQKALTWVANTKSQFTSLIQLTLDILNSDNYTINEDIKRSLELESVYLDFLIPPYLNDE